MSDLGANQRWNYMTCKVPLEMLTDSCMCWPKTVSSVSTSSVYWREFSAQVRNCTKPHQKQPTDTTGDLAPKANTSLPRGLQFPWGCISGRGWHFPWGVAISMEGTLWVVAHPWEGLNLVLTWLMAGGMASMGGGKLNPVARETTEAPILLCA